MVVDEILGATPRLRDDCTSHSLGHVRPRLAESYGSRAFSNALSLDSPTKSHDLLVTSASQAG